MSRHARSNKLVDGTGVRASFSLFATKRRRTTLTDYGEGIIESDILSDGDERSSELVPSLLFTEAAFGFTATILGGGGEVAAAEVVTVGMTMGDTERLSGLVASRILAAAAAGGCGGGGVPVGPQMDMATAGGLADGVRRSGGVGDGGEESAEEAVVAADAVRRWRRQFGLKLGCRLACLLRREK